MELNEIREKQMDLITAAYSKGCSDGQTFSCAAKPGPIEVGDEIRIGENEFTFSTVVITHIVDATEMLICTDGQTVKTPKKTLFGFTNHGVAWMSHISEINTFKKTGRHFPQIAKILKLMQIDPTTWLIDSLLKEFRDE